MKTRTEELRAMRTMAIDKYGALENLAPRDASVPEPGAGEVRVRVQTSALNPADFKVVLGRLKFLHGRRFPLVVGYDFSGTIDACGPNTEGFSVGQDVFGFLPYGPFNHRGAFAEYLVTPASEIAHKPASVSHQQAAAIATPGVTALQSLRDLGRLEAGQHVLVTGVSGGVGSLAVAIAKRLGATVTAIGSGRGLELATRQGATHVVDRTKGDVFAAAGGPFDVVLDAAGAYSWRQWKAHLRPGGTFVTTLPSGRFFVDKLTSLVSRSRAKFINVKARRSDLELLAGWLADGHEVPVDRVLPVRRVAEGLAALDGGGVLGRIVIDVANGFDVDATAAV